MARSGRRTGSSSHRGRHPGIVPVYSLTVVRTGRDKRDPPSPKRRAPPPGVRVPVFKVVLRKEGSIRVAETHANNAEAAANIAHKIIGDSPFEKQLVLLLNNQNAVVGAIVVGTTSSISSTAVSMRGVFTAAITHNASSVILAHNHPSGNLTPSPEDVEFARKVEAASEIMRIPVLDHLIVTPDPTRWRSYRASSS